MSRSEESSSLNFSGLTHDHTTSLPNQTAGQRASSGLEHSNGGHETEQCEHQDDNDHASTILILRRHPMYDCLVLIKRFRECLGGHSLEFPITKTKGTPDKPTADDSENNSQAQQPVALKRSCSGHRLVSRFLDGDDPIYQSAGCLMKNPEIDEQQAASEAAHFKANLDEQLVEGCSGELVHVPVNGLLDRLRNYTESGVAVDSRVYAFAMGLKTAERMLTTSSLRELQETPLV